MNIRELEALLRSMAEEASIAEWPTETRLKLNQAIRWCVSKRKRAITQRNFARLKADEQREMLR